MTKNRSLLCLLLFATLARGLPALRADEAPAAAPATPATATPPPPPPEEKTALDKQMDRIGKSARALRKQINDPAQNAASLQLVAAIRDAATISLTLVPEKADDLMGPDKDKFIADYQAGMKQFISAVDALSGALTAGDNVAAAKDLKQLFSLEKQDHRLFRKPEPK